MAASFFAIIFCVFATILGFACVNAGIRDGQYVLLVCTAIFWSAGALGMLITFSLQEIGDSIKKVQRK